MTLLSVQDAQKRIQRHLHVVDTEALPLEHCAGRVLASDILSTDLPLFDNSSVDGFAVNTADVSAASAAEPSALRVVADIPAGVEANRPLQPGEAARIMTGAPIPPGANAVIMIEDTDSPRRGPNSPLPTEVKALRAVRAGENIRARGMDIESGQEVLFSGVRLRPQDLGLLAMLGVANVLVFRRPRVAVLTSGDELLPLDRPLAPGKIYDSNSYTLSALIAGMGCDVVGLGIAPDEVHALQMLFERAAESRVDAIVSSAGVSVGAFDYVREIIQARGSLDFWRVNVRPGKPLAVGEFQGIPFIGLPGNPVSAFVGFELFVRPALGGLAGLESTARTRMSVTLTEAIDSDGRESYLRAVVEERQGIPFARLTGHQGSGNLLSLVQANALLIIPAGVKSLAVGDRAEVWLI